MEIMNLKQQILLLDGASDLPDAFLENICKIATQQNKINDQKWLKNSVTTALKRYNQQQAQKKEKELKHLPQKSQNIIEVTYEKKNIKEEFKKKKEVNIQKRIINQDVNDLYHLIEQLPRIENIKNTFPNIDRLAIKYIINNHGLWTLKLIALFKDPTKIFTDWAVHFTYALRHGFNIQKCIELNFHKDSDFMYSTVINSKEYLDNSHVRKEYWKWKRKENRENYRRKKNEMENKLKISGDDICINKSV
jgi:hypothetical protein